VFKFKSGSAFDGLLHPDPEGEKSAKRRKKIKWDQKNL
jgi:hypothetical protein